MPFSRHHAPSVEPFRMNAARTACRISGCAREALAMNTPRKSKSVTVSDDANDLSILFSSVWPRSSDEVGGFLSDAAFALGMREADLARSLGVSRATLSGWKTRGVIPATHSSWFGEEFPIVVLSGSNADLHASFRHAGIPAVLHLFRETAFNPFGLVDQNAEDYIDICRTYFGGLCRLALFLQNRMPIVAPVEETHARVGNLLGKVARAAAPRLKFRNVSQSVFLNSANL